MNGKKGKLKEQKTKTIYLSSTSCANVLTNEPPSFCASDKTHRSVSEAPSQPTEPGEVLSPAVDDGDSYDEPSMLPSARSQTAPSQNVPSLGFVVAMVVLGMTAYAALIFWVGL